MEKRSIFNVSDGNGEIQLLPIAKAAELARVTDRTIRKWIATERVTAVRDRTGRQLIDPTTLPNVESIARDNAYVEESTRTVQSEAAMVIRELVHTLKDERKHTERLMELALSDRAAYVDSLRDELAATREELAALHKKLRDALETEQDALDRTTQRETYLADWSRTARDKAETRAIVKKLLASWGLSKLGDKKASELADALIEITKASDDDGAASPSPSESDPQSDP